ncbi:hypothetical protein BC830DRAFT_1096207 [Chytriomyces sp. MP71]|nr:hypothetical protein BC830DRAFT_1096207 [Chytriomyces sp. MP71]
MLSLAILDVIFTLILLRIVAGFVFSRFHRAHHHRWGGRHFGPNGHGRCHNDRPWSPPSSPDRDASAAESSGSCPRGRWSHPGRLHHQFARYLEIPVHVIQALVDDSVVSAILPPSGASVPDSNLASSSASVPAATSASAPSPQQKQTVQPKHIVTETPVSFTIAVDVPGFKRGELTLSVIDDTRHITIAGASSTRNPVELTVPVSRLGDLSAISASAQDGVLTVVVPKKERDGRIVEVLGAGTEKETAGFEFA